MCMICSATQTFDPARHPDGNDPLNAIITETSDATNGTSTSYSISVGDTFRGTLDTVGDRDWVAITFEAGQTYTIDLNAAGSGAGTLADAYLRLMDGSGNQITFNDDGGPSRDSTITFTATSSGTYYISAGAFADGYTGTYELAVEEVAAPEVATTAELADYLVNGFWNDRSYFAHSFDTSSSNVITVDLSGLTAEGQQLARWAMQTWEMVANIDFQEVSSGAQITFQDHESGAFAGATSVTGSTINTAIVNVSTNWLTSYGTTIDSYSFQTYIHEIGHALGLGHQGNYNGSATYGTDNTFINDSWQLSVMSYFSQTENTNTNASFGYVMSAMMADILAIQSIYGAPSGSSETAGNTTWGANTNLGGYWADLFDYLANGTTGSTIDGNNVAFTIYDQGGIDTADLSFSTTNDRIDMRGGTFSDIAGRIGNVGIAQGTVIEHLIAGSGNDTISGNVARNNIQGRVGNDSIRGFQGNDTLQGQNGNDTLIGDNGNDRLFGGNGNDSLNGGAHNDSLVGGAGFDTLIGGNGNDTVNGGNGRDRATLGNGNDRYTDTGQGGVAGRDTVFGGNGQDYIHGGGGNDSLNGGAGHDTIHGGGGNDTVVGGNGRDRAYLGDGNDRFWDTGQTGTAGADRVFGGNGNDTIEARGGNDTLTGGEGEDTFIFAGSTIEADVVTDYAVGTDTLRLDDALWAGAGLSAAQVISTYASVVGGNVVFDFGGGNTITLNGVGSLAGLESDLVIF